jgi:putative DNA primase/helicase
MTDITLRAIARATGGDVVGREVVAPGPGHSRNDRSLSIRPTAGGILVHSFAGDGWQECQDHVARQIGLEISRRRGPSPDQRHFNAERKGDARLDAQREAERITSAVRLFNEAHGPYGSPVEAYLRSRKIALGLGAGEWVRFHPACPFAGQRAPTMICLVRDMKTDEPRAIHRTALDRDGNGIEINGHKRLSLGPIGGGAVKITSHADVYSDLGVGEGLETTLSLRFIRDFGQRPLWALLSAVNLSKLPTFPSLRKLWIATDHDAAGLRAARSLADRWRSAGREVLCFIPTTPGLDLNDLAIGGRLA